ncbi:peptide chain release factor N(5)-glutamine methyltransferase [Puia dinghuensis]|uniref:peptide chain release factor N(5)-glutamine methyltransferase n=1 Tax=Puia dinghuensis TaxID=1792502 RepID=A0A8J2UI82_9BACT|nr:peptide chain release factor N(5)-glutamine methyltransferase [Puia dinghuensis]GGB21683.1 release factor glutamine methyltransferase [Puia dinghuensis]
MDWFSAQKELAGGLTPLYGEREAAVIADWVMEAISGKKKLQRMMIRTEPMPPVVLAVYESCRDELLAHRPVQYVLGESWFGGLKFYVDERVLIPRPETEELVEWVIAEASGEGRLLDVGTGSGCIAVTLAHRLAAVDVYACDVSADALAVARRNAHELGVRVGFFELDFLDSGRWAELPPLRWLVSNPPYIPVAEKPTMATHVTDYEPGSALFVPNDDALVFYRALGEFARQRLATGGALFAEIHEEMGMAVQNLLVQLGAREVVLRKDLQGKQRMVKATW